MCLHPIYIMRLFWTIVTDLNHKSRVYSVKQSTIG